MEILVLETLKEAVTLFSSIKCDFFVENCIVVLENHNHASGCLLSVTGDDKTHFRLEWSSLVNKSSYGESEDETETDVIEHAAEAIGFFLAHKLTPYQVIRKAAKETGFDYWLCYDETDLLYNDKNFLNARFEISGIFREDKGNTVMGRVGDKKKQTDKSDYMQLPAYIAVVEFSRPQAYFIKK